jgi:hypothetical protein
MKQSEGGTIVDINGTKMWQNKDGTLDEMPVKLNPKVVAWFAKGLNTTKVSKEQKGQENV